MKGYKSLVTAALMFSGTGTAVCANPQYGLERQAFDVAVKQGLPPSIFVAMIGTESHFCPATVSSKGAVGLGQLMPGTARDLRVTNALNITQNLNASAAYLRAQFKTFGRWDLALAAYNAGAGNVKKYGGMPPFAETVAHVDKVLTRASALERDIPLITTLNTPIAQLRTLPSPTRPRATLLAASQAPAPRSVTGVQAPLILVSSPAAQRIAGGAGTASRNAIQPVPANLRPTPTTATSRPANAPASIPPAVSSPRPVVATSRPAPLPSAPSVPSPAAVQNPPTARIETTTPPQAAPAPVGRATPATTPPTPTPASPATASTSTTDDRILVVIRRSAAAPQAAPSAPATQAAQPGATQPTAPAATSGMLVIRVRK